MGYFDDDACEFVVGEAERLGPVVDVVNVGFDAENPHLPELLLRKIERFDFILIQARLGDQLCISELPQEKKIIVSFALNANHAAFMELKSAVNSVLSNTGEIRISCPAGTEISGMTEVDLVPERDTSIMRFPMSIFAPVPAVGITGELHSPVFSPVPVRGTMAITPWNSKARSLQGLTRVG